MTNIMIHNNFGNPLHSSTLTSDIFQKSISLFFLYIFFWSYESNTLFKKEKKRIKNTQKNYKCAYNGPTLCSKNQVKLQTILEGWVNAWYVNIGGLPSLAMPHNNTGTHKKFQTLGGKFCNSFLTLSHAAKNKERDTCKHP